MKRYSQQDKQWSGDFLGYSTEGTIGKWGCLLTCMAMACTKYGYDETPKTLNDNLKIVGGFQDALVIVRMINTIVPGVKEIYSHSCKDTPAPMDIIDRAINDNNCVIVELDYSQEVGFQNHWVILDKQLPNGDYEIFDPYPLTDEKSPTLLKRFGFGKSTDEVITFVYILDGIEQTSKPSENEEVVLKGKLTVTASWGLAFRSEPATNAPLISFVTQGFQVTPLDETYIDNTGREWQALKIWAAKEFLK